MTFRATSPLLGFLALALTSACACTYESELTTRPIPQAVLTVTRSEPTDGATDVPLLSMVDIEFNVAVDGQTVSDTDVRLLSGLVETVGSVRNDLLARRLRFIPGSALKPDLQYRVFLSENLRGVDGSMPTSAPSIRFRTGTTEGTRPPRGSQPRAEDIQSIWDDDSSGQRQPCTACHAPRNEPPRAPVAGVDLSSPAAAIASLRDVPSRGSSLRRVAPGDHATSYLMLQLIGEFGFTGYPMPPAGPRLAQQQLRVIADWIDAGAN